VPWPPQAACGHGWDGENGWDGADGGAGGTARDGAEGGGSRLAGGTAAGGDTADPSGTGPVPTAEGGSLSEGGRTWVTSPSSSSSASSNSAGAGWGGTSDAVAGDGRSEGGGLADGGAGRDGGSSNGQLDSDTAHLSVGDPVGPSSARRAVLGMAEGRQNDLPVRMRVAVSTR
jgi:hypothetical protein